MKNQQERLVQIATDIIQGDTDDIFKQIKYEEFDTTVRSFLEVPQQLDIYMADILNKAVPFIISDINNQQIFNKYIYSMIYTLIDVRGIQYLNRFFPNDAKNLQQTVQLLKMHQKLQNEEQQQANDNVALNNMKFAKIDQDTSIVQQNYRVSFIILYYLSILVITPFQINDLNSSGSLSEDIVELCLSYHNEAPKLGQMANEVLGRFLVRPDCDQLLQNVIKRGNDLLQNVLNPQSTLFKHQQKQQQIALWLQLLSFIVRFAKSSGKFIEVFYNVELLQPLITAPSREVRKITAVLCSRISQSYLNKQYSWGQSLIPGDKSGQIEQDSNQCNDDLLNEIQGFDVPEAFDAFVDGLLRLSEDEEGGVRTIAAQGLAGLCGKLPRMFSGEIIDALLDMCGPAGDASAWSGALTALANCAVKKLLSPQAVHDLIFVVKSALSQRFVRGGAVVRDSACLASWAIARGYHGYFLNLLSKYDMQSKNESKQTLEQALLTLIPRLAAALASTAVLSRDLQARRAAGAAFQELAGRIGSPLVPQAIEVAALCDYYALGDINVCYTQTAIDIANSNQIYKNQLLSYLLDAQIQGGTIHERQLAAELMTKLIFLSKSEQANTLLDQSQDKITCEQYIDENVDIGIIIEEELIQRIDDSENWTQWAGTIQLITLLVQQDGFKNIFQRFNLLYQKIIEFVANLPKSPTQDGQFQVITVLFQCYNTLIQHKQLELDIKTVVKTLQSIYQSTIYFRKNDLAVQNYEKLFDNSLYITIQLLQDANFDDLQQISTDKICLASMLQAISSKRIISNNGEFITQLYDLFKKNLTAQNMEIRLFVLRAIEIHVGDLNFSVFDNNFQNLYAIIKRSINDYALDKRGDVGALVRHRGSIVLRTLVKHLKENKHDPKIYDDLLHLHQQTIARNCCSKVETLKLLAIRSLFEDQQQGIQLVKCDINDLMSKYLNKQQKSNASDPESQIFNMAELTVYEIKKQLQLEDLLLVNNNYDLLYDVFLNDEMYKNTCFLELLSNFSLYTEKDLKQIINLIKMQNNDYIYDIILQQFDKVSNKGRQSTVQYSCIQAIDQLINHDYEPSITTVSQLIDKIDHYISQDSVVFQVYPHAFSIFEFYAYKYDIQLCFDLLVKYLTMDTIKVRDIAFNSILMLFIHKKVADQKIQEISAYDFMLVKPDVLQTQILSIKDLAKKTK